MAKTPKGTSSQQSSQFISGQPSKGALEQQSSQFISGQPSKGALEQQSSQFISGQSKTKGVKSDFTPDGDTTSITNGEIQYVGSLSLQVNESNLISDFQFDWSQVNQENYDDQTLTRNESVFSVPTLYTNLMSGEYATGVTPFRIQYLYASDENNFFSSWEHGTIRPLFAYGSGDQAFSYFKFSITYEVDELAVLEEKFARGSFEDKLLEAIGNIANNLNNQLNLDPKNQNLDFQKSKNKMINFKNLSNFSSKQETTIATETIVNSTTTSVITNGGY